MNEGEYERVETKCKLCQRPISVLVHRDYRAAGDPFRIIRLAACNRCADYRNRYLNLFAKVKKLSERIIMKQVTADNRERVHDALRTLLKNYMRMFAEYKGLDLPDWDEAILDTLLAKPTHFEEILGRVRTVVESARKLV